MINILHGLGLRFLALGHHTPFMVSQYIFLDKFLLHLHIFISCIYIYIYAFDELCPYLLNIVYILNILCHLMFRAIVDFSKDTWLYQVGLLFVIITLISPVLYFMYCTALFLTIIKPLSSFQLANLYLIMIIGSKHGFLIVIIKSKYAVFFVLKESLRLTKDDIFTSGL